MPALLIEIEPIPDQKIVTGHKTEIIRAHIVLQGTRFKNQRCNFYI